MRWLLLNIAFLVATGVAVAEIDDKLLGTWEFTLRTERGDVASITTLTFEKNSATIVWAGPCGKPLELKAGHEGKQSGQLSGSVTEDGKQREFSIRYRRKEDTLVVVETKGLGEMAPSMRGEYSRKKGTRKE